MELMAELRRNVSSVLGSWWVCWIRVEAVSCGFIRVWLSRASKPLLTGGVDGREEGAVGGREDARASLEDLVEGDPRVLKALEGGLLVGVCMCMCI